MISNASFQYWYNTKPNHLLYKDTENTNISWERKLHQLFHLYIQPTRNLFSQQRATTEAKMIKYLREPQQKWRWKQFQKKEEWEESHPEPSFLLSQTYKDLVFAGNVSKTSQYFEPLMRVLDRISFWAAHNPSVCISLYTKCFCLKKKILKDGKMFIFKSVLWCNTWIIHTLKQEASCIPVDDEPVILLQFYVITSHNTKS